MDQLLECHVMDLLENKECNMASTNPGCNDLTEIKVDVGVLKAQTNVLSQLCEKMDKVIEKLVDNQDRYISQVYQEMDKRRMETDDDIGELHARIDTVLEKMQNTERRLLDEIAHLRSEIANNNKSEKEKLDKLLEWRWTVAGGILVVSWLLAHFSPDIIKNLIR